MSSPFFSIIIPTYNREDTILSTIESVISQDYIDFEIIVVDDGSTDSTSLNVKSIVDNRLKYFKKKNEERAIARNYGVKKAKGKYITFLDSDDILYPQFLSTAFKLLKSHNFPEWAHLAYEIKTRDNKIIRRENNRVGRINQSLIYGNHLSCIGVVIRNEIIKTHKFNTDRSVIGSEDYLLWLELASKYELVYSNNISAYMLQHEKRSVINFNKEQLIERIEAVIRYALKNVNINKFLGDKMNTFIAYRYLYLCNHLSRSNNKKESFTYFIKALKHYPNAILARQSLSYIKSIFILE